MFASVALGLISGILFAAYPLIDLEVARLFFDDRAAKFPLAITYEWNLVRRVANWIPFVLLAPALFVLLRKIVYPGSAMLIAPSVVVFLLASFVVGPGLTSNLLLKENWGRPRPNHVQQFAGAADFQPWWRPSGACTRNCSFVSGEASQAFWAVAPAMLAPPQVRPVAMGAAVVFGASVGAMRVVFGRHFVSDIVFAGLITIAIVMGFYRLLLDPLRRNDARLERAVERTSVALHKATGAALAGLGAALAHAGGSLRHTGQHLHKRIACL
ncbi:phosphatase PAP2 family protein [Methyloceanibacter sp.]|uniref:phosphatase PAP2 family protein n=1 Tax=Methyloceanibacter sp. TaxID=1965321 RepID=UPI003D6CCBE3